MTGSKKVFLCISAAALLLCFNSSTYADEQPLRMATTTSTDNTGLLDYLAPHFKAHTGINWQWVAVGTGKALELGRNCDVDVLLVHAPEAEEKYVEEGYGLNRQQVMYNDFVVIGPPEDPAQLKGLAVTDAFKTVEEKKALFVSRGDNSGTNKKEISLWKQAGISVPDTEGWYIQTGQGMLQTITVAAERDGYTLTDRGTYIKYEANLKGNPPLVILVEGAPNLYNQYSVIAVNPERCSNVKYDLSLEFIQWVILPKTQKLIGNFELLGKRLFIPNAK